jgi:hypothetical protein
LFICIVFILFSVVVYFVSKRFIPRRLHLPLLLASDLALAFLSADAAQVSGYLVGWDWFITVWAVH